MFGNDKDVKIIFRLIDETKSSIEEIKGNLSGLKSSASGTGTSFLSLSGAMAAAQVAVQVASKAISFGVDLVQGAVQGMWETIESGADLQRLQVATYTLGKNAGKSAEEIDAMVKELEKTNTYGVSAWEAVNTFIMSGLEPMTKSLKRTSAEGEVLNEGMDAFIMVAKDFGAAAGVSSKVAIENMTTAIKQMRPEMLSTMGIQVNLNEAYEKYKNKLKLTNDQLTVAQRQEALLWAVMEQGTKVVGTYEDTYETAGKNLLSMEDAIVSIQQELGAIFNNSGFDKVTGNILDFIKHIREMITDNEQFRGVIERISTILNGVMADGFRRIAEAVERLVSNPAFMEFLENILASITGMAAGVLEIVVGAFEWWADVMEEAMPLYNELFSLLGEIFALFMDTGVDQDIKKVGDELKESTKQAIIDNLKWIVEKVKELVEYLKTPEGKKALEDFKTSVQQIGDAIKWAYDVSVWWQGALKDLVDTLTTANSKLREFLGLNQTYSNVNKNGMTDRTEIYPEAPITDLGNLSGGVELPPYATGTPFVPRDMMAFVHQGEAIIPAGQNSRSVESSITINFNSPIVGIENFQQAVVEAVETAQENLNRKGKYNLAL